MVGREFPLASFVLRFTTRAHLGIFSKIRPKNAMERGIRGNSNWKLDRWFPSVLHLNPKLVLHASELRLNPP